MHSTRILKTLLRHARPAAAHALLLGLALSLTAPLFAQNLRATIVGTDPRTNAGVADAQLIVIETRQKYFTNAQGEAQIAVPNPGFYTFRAITPDGTLVQPRLQITSNGQRLTLYTGEPPKSNDVADTRFVWMKSNGSPASSARPCAALNRCPA